MSYTANMVSHIHGSLVASGLCPGSWIMLMDFYTQIAIHFLFSCQFQGHTIYFATTSTLDFFFYFHDRVSVYTPSCPETHFAW